MRWPDKGDIKSDKFRVILTRVVNAQAGVGIVLRGGISNSVKQIDQISERVVMVKILSKPKETVIVPVYMPKSGHDDEKVEKVYEK